MKIVKRTINMFLIAGFIVFMSIPSTIENLI